LSYLSTKSPPFSERLAAVFARSAQKRDPKRSLGTALDSNAPEAPLPTRRRPAPILDPRMKTILVVSHEASRTGAPVLALNIVQQLSARYNVICLILGGGDLTDHFRKASASLYEADRIHMTDRELDSVIRNIATHHPLMFAVVNSIESRMALRALKAAGVPTISLIHEFSSYARPRSAFPDVLTLSTDTVFSTRMTLENAVADFQFYPGASIHVAPQGKCIVPAARGAASEALVEKLWLTRNLRPEAGNRKFLVIGLGTIELRKGVDLFIECATIIKRRPGGERFQFVWIGNGFDPEREVAYSAYLADQMKRAGLGSQMKILRATSQIELAYQSADLLLLSSRLDPLPNVAIDALMLGLPVLCFEKTTGIADFLSENGLGEPCVAQYLDTHDLARKVAALAVSEDLRTSVSDRSRAAAGSAFDMNAYVSKIEAIAVQAVGAEARVKEEVKAILASGTFRGDFFKPPEMETSPEEKLVEDYVRRMATGFGVRKPTPGFQPTVYSWLHSREGKTNGDPFADFLRKGLPDGPWLQSVIQNGRASKIAPHAGLRAAIHLHVLCPDQLVGIAERLKLNASAPDLFISVTSEAAAARTREALSGYRGYIVDVQVTPNLGRDIGPLLTQFGWALSASYDVIGHLHTKKSVLLENPSFAEARHTFPLENLVGGKRGGPMLDVILASMASDPAIGIVFPDDPHVLSWTGHRYHAEALAARMKCGELPEQFNFPIGAMFWTRSAVLKRFVELELAWGDYEPEPLPVDGMMVHAIERLFGVVPGVMGMTCAVTNVRGLTR
jgi:glycosyltransferase involved in cell wall biosynthesis